MLTRLTIIVAAIICASTAFAQPKPDWIADPKTGCKVWNNSPQPNESVSWSGGCSNGLATGRGVEQWFEAGKPTNRYEIGMTNGKREGHGVASYKDGSRYDGEFRNNEYEGHGIRSFADGSRYEGEFRGGLYDGHGVFNWATGNHFEGEFRAGKPNGNGTMISMGVTYAGNWTNGCFRQGERWATAFTNRKACGFE